MKNFNFEHMTYKELTELKERLETDIDMLEEDIYSRRKEMVALFEKGGLRMHRLVMYNSIPLSWADTVYSDSRYTPLLKEIFAASINNAALMHGNTEYHIGMYCERVEGLPDGTSIITFTDPYGSVRTPAMFFSEEEIAKWYQKICSVRVMKDVRVKQWGQLDYTVHFIAVDDVLDFGLYGHNDETKFSNRLLVENPEDSDDRGAELQILNFLKENFAESTFDDHKRLELAIHNYCMYKSEAFESLPDEEKIEKGFVVDGIGKRYKPEIMIYLFRYERGSGAFPGELFDSLRCKGLGADVTICPVKAIHISYSEKNDEYTVHTTYHFIWHNYIFNTKHLEDEGLFDVTYSPQSYIFQDKVVESPKFYLKNDNLGDLTEFAADQYRRDAKEAAVPDLYEEE